MRKAVIVLALILAVSMGCQSGDSRRVASTLNSDNERIDNESNKEVDVELKSELDVLLNEQYYALQISQEGSSYIKADKFFAHRLLEQLASDPVTEWKDSAADNYQIALKFQGYREIHVNLEAEAFWFEGEAEVYSAKGIQQLWRGYIIKLVNGTPIYSDFEKTVFSEIHWDLDEDGSIDDAFLFYDGDIRLRINEKEIVLSKTPYKPTFQSGRLHYREAPSDSANLEYIEDLGLLMYSFESYSIHGPFINISFFKYENGMIRRIWSNSDINCLIDGVDFDNAAADIYFPFANTTYHVCLNDKERKMSQINLSELEGDGVKLDDEYIQSIKENILCTVEQAVFKDEDEDGALELVIEGKLSTVGAVTPIRLEERVVFIFDLSSESIECNRILLERDAERDGSPFDYFMH